MSSRLAQVRAFSEIFERSVIEFDCSTRLQRIIARIDASQYDSRVEIPPYQFQLI